MRHQRLLFLACTAATIVSTIGCGGSGDERDEVRSAVVAFYSAVVNKDGERACSMLTLSVRRSLRGPRCPQLFESSDTDDVLRSIPEPRTIIVDGDHARVFIQQGTRTGSVRLLREDGEWKMEEF